MTTVKKGPVAAATEKTANRADELLARGGEAYTNARSNATAKYEGAKNQLVDTTDAAKVKVAEVHENARGYVKDNPEKSIGIAVGVGVVTGAIIALIASRRR